MRVRLGWIVVPAVALCACAAVDRRPYPGDWPPLASPDAGCRALEGTYRNTAAQRTDGAQREPYRLSGVLLPDSEAARSAATLVLRPGTGGTLEVTARGAAGRVLASRSYPVGSGFLACRDGLLVLDPARRPGRPRAPDNPLVGVVHGRIELRKARDGSLIVHAVDTATGMAYLVVPVHARAEHWYRFRLASVP